MKTEKIKLWEKFDPVSYVKDNYAKIHDEDRKIIKILVQFYERLPHLNKSLEIGGGPNLYPLMLALLYVDNIDVLDFSFRNVDYLKQQLRQPERNWYLFWDLLKKLSPRYRAINVIKDLMKKVHVTQGSIYKLPDRTYDLASMFFCADSITDSPEEFELACRKFVHAVKHSGFVAAAFMEKSEGYMIAGERFPSVSVDSQLLQRIFQPEITELRMYRIPKAINALRPGYTGMLLLTGRRF